MAWTETGAWDEPGEGTRVLVLGVGGAGCNSLGNMAAEWAGGPALAAMDTDAQMLASCGLERRIQVGRGLTQGLSTGGDPATAKLAAEEDGELIRELVSSFDVVFLAAGLGGGVGGGAAPVVARIAREENVLSVVFATLPFEFEGERRSAQAEESLRALRMVADIVITLPNNFLPEIAGAGTSLQDAFRKADLMIGLAIRAIWRLLGRTGIINLDFADLRQLAESSGGACRFGYGEGTGPNMVAEAVAEVMRSPLLDKGRLLSEAPALLVSIVGGPDLTLMDVQKVMSEINSLTADRVRLFMGAAIEESWRQRVALTVLAAESWHEPGVAPLAPVPEKPKEQQQPVPRATIPPKVEPVQKLPREAKSVQETLNFQPVDKGRFRNTEPTIMDGQDLDLPTYLRRSIKLSFER